MHRSVLLVVALALTFVSTAASAAARETARIADAVVVLDEIMQIREEGIPPALLRNAEAVAIIPGVVKAGFVLAGRFGRGLVVVRNEDGSWSNPLFVTITGGSIGWQAGGQSSDVVLVFRRRHSVDNIVEGKFTLGADAAVVAGPVGRRAEAAVDDTFRAEVFSYARSRGLFAGVSLEGSGLQVDHEANARYYGSDRSPQSIIGARDAAGRESVRSLHNRLSLYASE